MMRVEGGSKITLKKHLQTASKEKRNVYMWCEVSVRLCTPGIFQLNAANACSLCNVNCAQNPPP